MDQGTLEGIGTLLAMLAFGAVCVWAYSGRNKAGFDEAAQLPFLDELPAANKQLRADSDDGAGETAIETSTNKEGNGI